MPALESDPSGKPTGCFSPEVRTQDAGVVTLEGVRLSLLRTIEGTGLSLQDPPHDCGDLEMDMTQERRAMKRHRPLRVILEPGQRERGGRDT